MTYKEKLKLDHPEYSEHIIEHLVNKTCPVRRGYPHPVITTENCYPEVKSVICGHSTHCWNQGILDIPSSVASEKDHDTTIKDSGNRREFETGAVRDMQEGKGRCDLMPLEVVARMIAPNNGMVDQDDFEPVIKYLYKFIISRDTGNLYSALDDFCLMNYDGETFRARNCSMLLEVAKHFEEGAKKYGENNWQKGLPVNCYIDSAIRHYLKWLRGDKDEPHDRAFVWNIMCCIWEADYHKKDAD